jgi:hypothetical protein
MIRTAGQAVVIVLALLFLYAEVEGRDDVQTTEISQ